MDMIVKEKIEKEVKSLRENIKAIRLSKNLGQEKVADLLGMDNSTYSKIENGKIELTAVRLAQLANAFSMRIIDIISWPHVLIESSENLDKKKVKAILQIELDQEKKDQVIRMVFGDNVLEILNK